MLHDPFCQLLTGIVWRVLLDEPAQQIAAAVTPKPIENVSWSLKER